MSMEFRLTEFSPLGGCACKLAPDVLDFVLQGSRLVEGPHTGIGGNWNNEDCAFFPLASQDDVLLATVDFFSPVVDDPFTFGQVAAANALSDIYAKGGRPIFALAILGWPIDKIPQSVARTAFEGLKAKCEEAGVPLLGGHSIQNATPLLGLSVNGLVQRSHLKYNSTGRAGCRLFLSKPLGSGVYSTALKFGKLPHDDYLDFVGVITRLNSFGTSIASLPGIAAMTDITGFGLAGHLLELCKPAGLTAVIEKGRIPVLPLVEELFRSGIETRGGANNRRVFGEHLECSDSLWRQILSDPQTNGGLLVAVAAEDTHSVVKLIDELAPSVTLYEIGFLSESNGKAGVLVR